MAGDPAAVVIPTMTTPSIGTPEPNAQASTARVATPGTRRRPGSSSASAREAGLRRIRSASRYAHAPVVTPVSAIGRRHDQPEPDRMQGVDQPEDDGGDEPQPDLQAEQEQRGADDEALDGGVGGPVARRSQSTGAAASRARPPNAPTTTANAM